MIYLDNAATTYPKPPEVLKAAKNASAAAGGNPGRGSHSLALAASEVIYDLRCELAELFSLAKPENCVLTFNATYALNIAIHALWRAGHVLVSDMEHNSALRPVAARSCDYTFFDALNTQSTLADIERKCRRNTVMLVCTLAPNTISLRTPMEEIAEFCARRDIRLIVDASQGAGYYELDLSRVGADAVCLPSHKGLYGLQGMGAVLFNEKYSGAGLAPLALGGSGVASISRDMPKYLPERLEAGTLSVPVAAAWIAGIRTVRRIGTGNILAHTSRLRREVCAALRGTPGVTLYGDDTADGSIVLFNIDGIDPASAAAELDRRGICVRAGLHCAPTAHQAIGTGPDGAVRASFGIFNTRHDASYLAKAVKKLAMQRGALQ